MKIQHIFLLFASLIFGSSVSFAQQVVSYPYNPDANADGFIETLDLIDFLSVYSTPFVPAELYLDGVSMGEILMNLQSIIDGGFVAGENQGDFLRWNEGTSSWETENILQNLQIADVSVQGDAIFLEGIVTSGDVAVSGAIASQSIVVESIITTSNLSVAEALTVGGSLTAHALSADNIQVAVDANVQGDLNVNGTFTPSKVTVNGSPVTVDNASVTSYPLVVQGGQHGIAIGLETDGANGNPPADDQYFLKFGAGDVDSPDFHQHGSISGNSGNSPVVDIMGTLISYINGGGNSSNFVTTCPWEVEFSHFGGMADPNTFMRVYVQDAQGYTFPNDMVGVVHSGTTKYVDLPFATESYEFFVPEAKNISFEYHSEGYQSDPNSPPLDLFGELYPCADQWSWDNSSIHNIHFKVVGPYGTVVDTDIVTCLNWIDVFGTDVCTNEDISSGFIDYAGQSNVEGVSCLGIGAQHNYAHSCPDPASQGSVSGNYGTVSTMGAQQSVTDNMSSVNDMIDAMDEVNMILAFLNSSIDVVTSFFPPGIPFDFFDLLDAGLEMVTATIDLGLYYQAISANKGVAFNSGSADYAEWIEKEFSDERLSFGDVVGVSAGKVSKKLNNASHFMVISKAPMILGNLPPQGENLDDYAKVAFMGQVPVKVRGRVSAGDYLLALREDGTATAKSESEMKTSDFRRIVGIAWEGSKEGYSNDKTVQYILTAVGLNQNDLVSRIELLEDQILKLQEGLELLATSMNTDLPATFDSMFGEIKDEQLVNATGMTSQELEFFEFAQRHSEPTVENRIAIANQVTALLNEQYGLAIEEEMPFIKDLMTKPEYARSVKMEFQTLIGEFATMKRTLEKKVEAKRGVERQNSTEDEVVPEPSKRQ
jgi:hypothetical protein